VKEGDATGSYRGRVTPGKGVGRRLGFPTANVFVTRGAALLPGVYAAEARLGGREHQAAAFVRKGSRPGGQGVLVELHLLDYSGEFYGREVSFRLVKFIRPAREFSSDEALRQAIAADIDSVRAALGT